MALQTIPTKTLRAGNSSEVLHGISARLKIAWHCRLIPLAEDSTVGELGLKHFGSPPLLLAVVRRLCVASR